MRAWGVKGDDGALAHVIEPLNIGGFYHALSVAVLGSYLGNFAAGDANRAPGFSRQDAKESDDPRPASSIASWSDVPRLGPCSK